MIINKKYNINNYFLTIILAFSIVWIIYFFTPNNNYYFYST